MNNYRDWDNDSGVVAYENGDDYIIVEFKKGKFRLYTYTYGSAGQYHIENMKRLAENGDGLNEYIIEHKVDYANKK